MNLKRKWGLALMIGVTTLAVSCKKEPAERTYSLNNNLSTATWKGYKTDATYNEGTIGVQSSDILVKNGMVVSGSFDMPLSTLKNLNLPTQELKEQLIHHLKTADFFNMALYPSVSFRIGSVATYSCGVSTAIAGANYTVTGDFTMLGKPLQVSFPAKIEVNDGTISVDAVLKIDRTRWGMSYGTADTLTPEMKIMPEVGIELHLRGDRR